MVAATGTVGDAAAARHLPISLSGLSQQSFSRWPVFLHRVHTTRGGFSVQSTNDVDGGSLGRPLLASLADFLAWARVDRGKPTVATCKYFSKPARKLLRRKLSAGRISN